ncbi:EscI/YscI/HrpB family type III secretion system inner rod protein [Pandoraea sputorum]|uniref:Type III secretion apparatus protein, YscI/HrpB, C-terminal domain n=2 Tax=Pandoraea sputorum TaxID=93222 RepID=A0A239SA94_9BURK|nr:EscI/YscI/HrpB family type III secretion system inner rod protein [Pandoraea sputorum]SNU82337.1 type III secretion apparatus protein, YscI/HrpB, C-terminal domain [Pandoraea sputorum]VVE46472.1 EscI/YscI/HrpB family type III secretion system inner rod protein [Pandoraea sputorum]
MTTFSSPALSAAVAQTSAVDASMKPSSAFPAAFSTAEKADAVRFNLALANAAPLPEHHLLSAANKLAGDTEYLAQRVMLDERSLDDPARLLATQLDMTERVLALEFVAKAAGATTQGVNKLVHMQ